MIFAPRRYLPAALGHDELSAIVEQAIVDLGGFVWLALAGLRQLRRKKALTLRSAPFESFCGGIV